MRWTDLPAGDLVETFDHPAQFLVRRSRDALTDSLCRERAHLADLDPRTFHQAGCVAFKSERESGARFLAGHGDRNHGSRAAVENMPSSARPADAAIGSGGFHLLRKDGDAILAAKLLFL